MQIYQFIYFIFKILNDFFSLGLGTIPPPLNPAPSTTPTSSDTTSTPTAPQPATTRPGSDAFSNMMASMVET
jgi:hypothetical protein